MNLTQEELLQIEEQAGLFLNIEEIALLLNKNKKELKAEIKKENTPANIAYNKGKTITKMELRKNIIKMAKHGSPNAEAMVNKYIKTQEIEDKK
jgi:IS30 family transposase